MGFSQFFWPLAFYPRRVGGEINTRRISTMVVSHLIVFFVVFGYFVFFHSFSISFTNTLTHSLFLFFSFSLFLFFSFSLTLLLEKGEITWTDSPHTTPSSTHMLFHFFSPLPPSPNTLCSPSYFSLLFFCFLLFAFCFLLFLIIIISLGQLSSVISHHFPPFLLHESVYPRHKMYNIQSSIIFWNVVGGVLYLLAAKEEK